MMTCRLLCALLVLALSCCPSVCMTIPEKALVSEAPVDGKGAGQLSHTPGGTPATTLGEPGSTVPGPVTEQGSEAGNGGAATDPQPQPNAALNNLQGKGTDDKKKTESGTSSSAEQRNKSEEDSAQKTTTTTTTLAPTTTTTSTTTTTTETPTTTTTRAPSRLREVDGSLSSSAWVCAPLLLAVSALAYTALG
ncbi:putative mucin TcMUCII [Trypanosoma cruzi]|uniref:Mucin TcMUCII, putative n=2 Tax=Trypanosoma cruzi TaxID=5693 RepID=Q4E4X4_TRYCC|nr:mucin TcMUCII, putative [Trypanosoma cruzi]EAN99844.1 mucin TcMUCII, putative [Trypanosoma cruzi]PWV21323.1 putative mucin TcMUCII [Trypanosoma cruzi]|eukprot:XP_821695.1 mucin TcMUCII [Trypanosoma cruzi strain CL Brener]